jgi:hypothetical protein
MAPRRGGCIACLCVFTRGVGMGAAAAAGAGAVAEGVVNAAAAVAVAVAEGVGVAQWWGVGVVLTRMLPRTRRRQSCSISARRWG